VTSLRLVKRPKKPKDPKSGGKTQARATTMKRLERRVAEFSDAAELSADALRDALEQQKATAQILRVIASSRTSVQPVFDTIVQSSVRLCGGFYSLMFLADGEQVTLAATYNVPLEGVEALEVRYPLRMDSAEAAERLTVRAMSQRRVLQVVDMQSEANPSTESRGAATAIGHRAVVAVPMLGQDNAIGVLIVSRREARRFADNEVSLLRTFADQAVIAIENVRLFNELRERNGALTESLNQQTATSEILRIISESAFDIQPVAHYGPAGMPLPQQIPTGQPINRDWLSGRAVVDRRTIHVPDLLAATDEYPLGAQYAKAYGHRTTLAVPMIRDDRPVGVILVRRLEVRPFTDKQIELLQTFARQAVIAIENVRMFNEVQEKTLQLQAANRHKDEFLASMSHELRTPLNAVIGFSEILLERMFGDVNEKQEEYLNDILASARHLLSLINDILDLTKIEAGRMELDLEHFDVSVAIENALVLVRERALRKALSLDWKTDSKLGAIRADQRKFKQILLNLLSNAVKFTPEGGRITVDAGVSNGEATISVIDTGIGIAPEDHEIVFEEFRQVGETDKKVEGTGLGLALCRRFVELHGGRIWVTSEVAKGSTFTFTIPIDDLPNSSIAR
jgi:signal transduction histidine kinase